MRVYLTHISYQAEFLSIFWKLAQVIRIFDPYQLPSVVLKYLLEVSLGNTCM